MDIRYVCMKNAAERPLARQLDGIRDHWMTGVAEDSWADAREMRTRPRAAARLTHGVRSP
ncbi:hypothetical protein [Rubinisphaera italica]|uniref:hypothetical protein n=1 Tax=Rubinisphaera italica TaxID=2527969 RepID=UPI0011B3FE64|nr:hypothetical protein [Rubinisphaera italica]